MNATVNYIRKHYPLPWDEVSEATVTHDRPPIDVKVVWMTDHPVM